jgi:hypothetical protein
MSRRACRADYPAAASGDLSEISALALTFKSGLLN